MYTRLPIMIFALLLGLTCGVYTSDVEAPLSTLAGHLGVLGQNVKQVALSRADAILQEVNSEVRIVQARAAETVAELEKKATLNEAWAARNSSDKIAVIVIDIQNDFLDMPLIDPETKAKIADTGSLHVPGTHKKYLNMCNGFLASLRLNHPIIFTQDWHPPHHVSFASRWQELLPGDNIKQFSDFELPEGFPGGARTQKLWPDHCKQEQGKPSPGALIAVSYYPHDISVKKGMRLNFDSYSGFQDDGGGFTAMDDVLAVLGAQHLIIFGIATDVCVKYSVLHALERVKNGLYKSIYVVVNLCRGVDKSDSIKALQEISQDTHVRLCWLESASTNGEIPVEELRKAGLSLEVLVGTKALVEKIKADSQATS